MSDIASRKAELRRTARATRDAVPVGCRIEASLAIAEHAAAWLDFEAGTIVGAYLPIGSEADPRPLMAMLADRRARLAVPALVDGDLVFRELVRGGALEPQGFGTHAPGASAATLEPAILLVPMLAFDDRCARIGYGKGFYDRAIGRLAHANPGLRAIGLAYAVQRVEAVPTDAGDRFLDAIVRETGVLVPSASASGTPGR